MPKQSDSSLSDSTSSSGGNTGGGNSTGGMHASGGATDRDSGTNPATGGNTSAGTGGGTASGGTGGATGNLNVTMIDPAQTIVHGSLTAGNEYTDDCPGDQVVIGYNGWASDRWMQGIQTVCGQVTLISTGSQYQVSVAEGTTLPPHGGTRGTPWQRPCPSNEVVVGFDGRSSGYLDALAPRCAKLLVSADGSTLSIGTAHTLQQAGPNAGAAFTTTDCPAGQIATGSYIRADSFPRAFGLFCGTPIVVFP